MAAFKSTGPQDATQAIRSASLAEFPDHPKRILLADDEHLVATGLTTNLQDLGYDVVGPAADGEEAVQLARDNHPDLALLDIQMGKHNGLDAAQVLFQEMGVPVIIFSAYSDQAYVDSGQRIGVFGYLLKPVTQDQLRVAISVGWGRFLDQVGKDSEISQLKQRLENRKIIEQAKWVIVSRKEIGESEAMKMLQVQARNSRRQLVDVARAVLESEKLLAD